MARVVLITQANPEDTATFRNIFEEWGDAVVTAENLDDLGNKLRTFTPELIVLDIAFFGKDWAKRLPTVRNRLPNTDILFTHSTPDTIPEVLLEEYKRWGILTGPFTRYGVRMALQEGYTQIKGEKAERPNIRFPLRLKLTWPYFLLALVITMVTAFLVTQVVFDSIEERFTNQLIEAGKLSSEWMVTEETRLLESLRLVANTQGLAEAMQANDAETLRELSLPLAVNNQLDSLELLTTQGLSVLALRHREGGGLEEYEAVRGESVYASWDFVQAVMAQSDDGIGDKYAGLAQADWGDYFYISGPVYAEDGALAGIILVGTRLENLVQGMRAATFAQTTIYDMNGQPLASTFLESRDIGPEQYVQALSEQDSNSLVNNVIISGIEYSEMLGPLEVRQDADLGVLGVAIPQNFLINTSLLTRAQIMGVLLAALLLIVLIGYFLASRISAPLRQLMRASNEVARGNLRVELEQSGSDEVTALTYYFNRMVDSLRHSNLEILEAYESSLEGWSRALTLRDHKTDEHSRRVLDLTMRMARALNLNEQELMEIRRGALLHDIGKMAIPDRILLKPGALTAEERQMIEKHPQYAYEMLRQIPFLQKATEIPYAHHEKWDGTGYPRGLKGENIPLSARIFAIADVFDALSSDRPYRRAWPETKVLTYIQRHRGTHFDPKLVDLFLQLNGSLFQELLEQADRETRKKFLSQAMGNEH
ncbi:MAG: HD domain-containing protein [Chloroflexi bacterium]|nr:MAG: HD domain-containing protein [Chloroflexota bacterium]MBL1196375.1 HD domain-containing protein [Chloroflexota bacterium]NOH13670.1 HD domain-containing protein [Chloroflexota bacterium]